MRPRPTIFAHQSRRAKGADRNLEPTFKLGHNPLIRAGMQARDHVDAMLGSFTIETITVDAALARRAAAVRARTNLRLPDAYALGTAIHAEHRGHSEVSLASFDESVLRAHSELHPN